MKALFEGYYDPAESDIRALWADALIVLDTNVLLNLYRVPEKARKEIMNLLESQRERLWIPYQVAAEFQRNRLKALKDEYDKAKSLATTISKAHVAFKQAIQSVQFSERGSSAEVDPLMKKISDGVMELSKLADGLAQSYVSPKEEDPVAEFLTNLLDGKVGGRPGSQEELDALYRDASEMYSIGAGPGHLDQAKAGDKYVADGLIYDRQYGDYVLWSQLLNYCKETEPAGVLLITSDVKEDWWLDTKSVSGLRPQPELVMDIRRRGGVSSFWMYTLVDFVKQSQNYLKSGVSDDTITDVEQVDHYRPVRASENVFSKSLEQSRASEAKIYKKRLFNVAGEIGDALGAGKYRMHDGTTLIAVVPGILGDGEREYAMLDVTDWPKESDSFVGLEDHIRMAVHAGRIAQGLVLYDAVMPPDFWLDSEWGWAIATRVGKSSPNKVDVIGASSNDAGVVLVPIYDERPYRFRG
ncbi:PIN-like domain-containing protein [Stenotrophomonas maltophilia]|uniref:PIN-like domain-containing protein n=1 Tax=Stenotrophomonas maltophilia TaxID=40324 RepID=UPI0039F65A10